MAVERLVRFHPTNLTKEKYDESVKLLEEKGAWPRTASITTSSSGPKGI